MLCHFMITGLQRSLRGNFLKPRLHAIVQHHVSMIYYLAHRYMKYQITYLFLLLQNK